MPLEFYERSVWSRNLSYSQGKVSKKVTATLDYSQIPPVFQTFAPPGPHQPKITTYAMTPDVIGHDVTVDSDISFERS